MVAEFKQMTDFFREVGADNIAHTNKTYVAHAIGVYNDLRRWGAADDICHAGLFHSIYGTEIFQSFKLPLERRGELREMIGERAERLAYWNCMMDRSVFDSLAARREPPYLMRNRETGEECDIGGRDYDDLCTIHLCDWLEQVPRSQKWDYRRDGYRSLAERLGGVARDEFDRVFAGH